MGMPSPSQWHLGSCRGGTPAPRRAGAAVRARRGAQEVSGAAASRRHRPAKRQEAVWLPAPRRASGARPAPALALWFSSSGKNPGDPPLGSWVGGKHGASLRAAEPAITNQRALLGKGMLLASHTARWWGAPHHHIRPKEAENTHPSPNHIHGPQVLAREMPERSQPVQGPKSMLNTPENGN